jgi:hypothetical protein
MGRRRRSESCAAGTDCAERIVRVWRLRGCADSAGDRACGPGGNPSPEVRVLLKGDPDRLGDRVRPVGDAAQVPIHGPEKLGGQPQAQGHEFDRGFR